MDSSTAPPPAPPADPRIQFFYAAIENGVDGVSHHGNVSQWSSATF
jgi:hypothetical protein